MKMPIWVFLAATAATAFAQPIPLSELVEPNNAIRDKVYGIGVTFPQGWEIQGATRWGRNNKENTIFFRPMAPFVSRPALYYQPRTNFDSPAAGQELAHFMFTAGTREAARLSAGFAHYKNRPDTFNFTRINGRPAFQYFASYDVNGKEYFEYFTRVLGDTMMAMFFTQGPVEEREIMRQAVDQMTATVHVP